MARDHYLDPYRRWVDANGVGFEATLWANPRAQRLRFEVFANMCHMEGKRIVDAGCSRGDFAAFLLERQVAFEQFVGVDGVEAVVTFAAERGFPRSTFLAGDFLKNPDLLAKDLPHVVCISGSLNTMTDRQVIQALEAAWASASETLLFNFLTDLAGAEAPSQTGPARRLDALKILTWATDKTSDVIYRQDYFNHGHDATIRMQR